MARRSFGSIEARGRPPRFRARYRIGPDAFRVAPTTFATKGEAEAWLAREQVRLEQAAAGSPKAVVRQRPPKLRDYARQWIEDRPLRPSTRYSYEGYLRLHIAATAIGGMRLDEITPADVRAWHAAMGAKHPTGRARRYAFLKAVLKTAVDDDLIDANPCRIVGGGQARARTVVEVLTPAQVDALAAELDDAGALAVYLGAYGQLRVGEVLALRRRDVDVARGVNVVRQATPVGNVMMIGAPKTGAGVRTVALPAFVLARLNDYLKSLPAGRDVLLFASADDPAVPMKAQTFTGRVHRAAQRANLPASFRFHHLRHSGLTLLAEAGASVAELQARAGHSTPSMALRYQHARAERDRALAALLDEKARRRQ